MSISAIKAYTNPAVNAASDASVLTKRIETGNRSFTGGTAGTNSANAQSNLITRNERDFFIRLFPDNAEQLEKHEVFNRNGRLQSAGVTKGIIVDGRI